MSIVSETPPPGGAVPLRFGVENGVRGGVPEAAEAYPTAEAPDDQAPPADHRRDRIAQAYFGLWGSAATQECARRRVHWMAEQALGPRVLDVGCSEGVLGLLLAREGFEVVGLDVNAEAIAYADDLRSREHEATARRLRFLVSDVMRPSEELEPFDTVFLGEILEHVCQPRLLLARAHDLLRTDGRLVVTTPYGYFPHPDHKQEFRAARLADYLGERFDVESFGIRDGYVRIVAHRRGAAGAARTVGPDALLREVEEVAIELQKRRHALDRRLVEAEREKRELQERLHGAQQALDARHRDYAAAVTELGFVRRRNAELEEALRTRKEHRSGMARALRRTLNAPKKLLRRARRSRGARQAAAASGAPGVTA